MGYGHRFFYNLTRPNQIQERVPLTLLFFTLVGDPVDLKFLNAAEKMSLNLHLRSEHKTFLSV